MKKEIILNSEDYKEFNW